MSRRTRQTRAKYVPLRAVRPAEAPAPLASFVGPVPRFYRSLAQTIAPELRSFVRAERAKGRTVRDLGALGAVLHAGTHFGLLCARFDAVVARAKEIRLEREFLAKVCARRELAMVTVILAHTRCAAALAYEPEGDTFHARPELVTRGDLFDHPDDGPPSPETAQDRVAFDVAVSMKDTLGTSFEAGVLHLCSRSGIGPVVFRRATPAEAELGWRFVGVFFLEDGSRARRSMPDDREAIELFEKLEASLQRSRS